ncbi:MAG: HlyD family efflux transporter periplasmic adaptor subunit [bacterium]
MNHIQRLILFTVILLTTFSSCNRNGNLSDAYGNFEATELIVSAESAGELIRFEIEEGDRVQEGQLVGIIDTTDLVISRKLLYQQRKTIGAQLKSINSEIEVAEQQLQNSLVNQKRTQNLYDKGAATQKQLDDINGLVDVNRKQILAIKSRKEAIINQMSGIDVQVEQINDKIEDCLISNPMDGTILVKYAEQGELAGMGRPLYKLADLKRMKLKAYISGDQLPHLKIGQEVDVIIDDSKKENRTLKGIVEWISSTAEFTPKTIQTKEERVNLTYAIKVAVENDGTIKIGMPGEVNFMHNMSD